MNLKNPLQSRNLRPDGSPVPRPLQQIPIEEARIILEKHSGLTKQPEIQEEPGSPEVLKPIQQIPLEDLKQLLEGSTSRKNQQALTTEQPAQIEVLEDKRELQQVEAAVEVPRKKEAEKAPIEHIRNWLKKLSKRPEKKPEMATTVTGTVLLPPEEEIARDKQSQVAPQLAVPVVVSQVQGPAQGHQAKMRELIADPPLRKQPKKVQIPPKTKKKPVEEKPKKKLSYEDAVEAYERKLAEGKQPVVSNPSKKALSGPVPTPPPPRFSRAEINKLLIIKVMPSKIRSFLASRNQVPFRVMCGIYQYEFIKLVENREEGLKVMEDLKDALNYDSILETFQKRKSEVYAVYSRAKMEHRGRYSGTPLHPKLEERF